MDYRKIAKEFISAGFCIIPTTSNKIPSIGNWRIFQKRSPTLDEIEKNFSDCEGVAMLCGGIWRVVCIDVDCKNDLIGNLFDRVKEAIPNRILLKCYIQSTVNNGHHIVFKAPASRLSGNEKLASRYTTPEERHVVYLENYEDPATRPKALNIAYNYKFLCTVETRSGDKENAGGYFLIAPSKGYKPIYGKIGELTEEEYDEMMAAIRSLNEVRELEPKQKLSDTTDWEKSPFEHFNEEGDILSILTDNGWEITDRGKRNIRIKRPGKTSSKSSGMVDVETNLLYVFSSGSIFECNRGYNAVSVLSILNFEGDMSKTYHHIVDIGFGIKK
jgi:hypothetical protein